MPALRERLGSAAAELGQLFPQMGHAGPVTADPMMSKLRLFEAQTSARLVSSDAIEISQEE